MCRYLDSCNWAQFFCTAKTLAAGKCQPTLNPHPAPAPPEPPAPPAPPSASATCALVGQADSNVTNMTPIRCTGGIKSVVFANYGANTGDCQHGGLHASHSCNLNLTAAVSKACVGATYCSLSCAQSGPNHCRVNDELIVPSTDPCGGFGKTVGLMVAGDGCGASPPTPAPPPAPPVPAPVGQHLQIRNHFATGEGTGCVAYDYPAAGVAALPLPVAMMACGPQGSIWYWADDAALAPNDDGRRNAPPPPTSRSIMGVLPNALAQKVGLAVVGGTATANVGSLVQVAVDARGTRSAMATFSFEGGTLRLAATSGAAASHLCLGTGSGAVAAPADTAAAVGDDPVPPPPPPPQLSLVACSDPRAKGWAAVPC